MPLRFLIGLKIVAAGTVVSLLLRYHGLNEPILHYVMGLITATIVTYSV